MTSWLVVVAAFAAGVVVANAVTVRRYSAEHVSGELALAGRGLFFSRTPDGTWWRLRLRTRRCTTTYPTDWGEAPPDAGVREPRRPPGSGPLGSSVKLDLPDC